MNLSFYKMGHPLEEEPGIRSLTTHPDWETLYRPDQQVIRATPLFVFATLKDAQNFAYVRSMRAPIEIWEGFTTLPILGKPPYLLNRDQQKDWSLYWANVLQRTMIPATIIRQMQYADIIPGTILVRDFTLTQKVVKKEKKED